MSEIYSNTVVLRTASKERLMEIMCVVHEALIAAGASPVLGSPYFNSLAEETENVMQLANDQCIDLSGVELVLYSPES